MSRPKKGTRAAAIYPSKRKTCPMCQRDLPWTAFYPRRRAESGHVLKVRSKCKQCESAMASDRWNALSDDEKREQLDRKRDWWHQQRQTDQEWDERRRREAAEYARWKYATDPEHREKIKARANAQKQDPEVRARHNAARLARARAARAAREAEGRRLLPIAPFRDWINRTGMSDVQIGDLLGVSARLVYKWRHEVDVIRLDMLDQALAAAGEPALIHELYDWEATADAT